MEQYTINKVPFFLWSNYKKEGDLKADKFTTDKGSYQVVPVSKAKYLSIKYILLSILVSLFYFTSIMDFGVNAFESIISMVFIWLCYLITRYKGPLATMAFIVLSYISVIASLFFVEYPGLIKYHLFYFTINLISYGLSAVIIRDYYFRDIGFYAIKERVGVYIQTSVPKENSKALKILLALSVFSIAVNGFAAFYSFQKAELERAAYIKEQAELERQRAEEYNKTHRNGATFSGKTEIKVYPYMEFECKSNLQPTPQIIAPFESMDKEFITLPVESWYQDDFSSQYYFKVAKDKSAKEIFTCRMDQGWFTRQVLSEKGYTQTLKKLKEVEEAFNLEPTKEQGGTKWVY